MSDFYQVALSFAGEQRAYVDKIAQCLRQAEISVYYDDFEKHDSWGKDLYQHLSDIYQKRAQYCIVFVSKEYEQKVWPSHELRNAQARALQEKDKEYILPVRFDDTDLPGLTPTIRYLDFRSEGADGICRAILAKLGKVPAQSRERQRLLKCELSPRAYLSAPELQRIEFPKLLDCEWGANIALSVVPSDAGTEAFYAGLRGHSKALVVAYGFDVAVASVRSAARKISDGIAYWNLILTPEETSFTSFMEMGTGTTSADQLAELRARRILLNENPYTETKTESLAESLNSAMTESLIRGADSRLKILGSDFPIMYEGIGNDQVFLEAAWIKAAADLKLSGSVERIERLVLSLQSSRLQVDFVGYRQRKFSNVDPYRMQIAGEQELK